MCYASKMHRFGRFWQVLLYMQLLLDLKYHPDDVFGLTVVNVKVTKVMYLI